MGHFEKQVEKNIVYTGRIVTVRSDKAELENGNIALREVVEHSGGVGIVAIDAQGRVVLVRQFRYPMSEELLEIPAGKLERGEEPLACAARELSEETGLTAESFVDLGAVYPSPGYCQETLYVYLAVGVTEGKAHLDEDEFLSVERIPLDEFADMIMENRIRDAKTVIGILKAQRYLQQHSV